MTGRVGPATLPDKAAAHCAGGSAVLERPETSPLWRLKDRSDFLAAARARHRATPGFVVQGRKRADRPVGDDAIRVGFTCSKKVGNAVARNRAKRRLRALARLVLPQAGRAGWDYVLIGRPGATATRDFAQMQADLAAALDRLHGERPRAGAPR